MVEWKTAQQLLEEQTKQSAQSSIPPWRKRTTKADDVPETWGVLAALTEQKVLAKDDIKKATIKKGTGTRPVKKQDSRTKRYLTRQSCKLEEIPDEQPDPFQDATQAWQPPQSPEGDEEL
jgi:hypothetical protein